MDNKPSQTNIGATKNLDYKRLIVLCDGTSLQSDAPAQLTKDDPNRKLETWVQPSNIARLCTFIAASETHESGREIPQVTFYQNGIGTSTRTITATAKVIGNIKGTGVNENVAEVFVWLLSNWNVGDEIFIFGFSRGAHTAHSLAGLIHNVGLGKSVKRRFHKAFHDYINGVTPKTNNQGETPKTNDQKDKQIPVSIKVVGVWDTVLGSHTKTLYDTHSQDGIEHMFHALALDEVRSAFSPTLMFLRPGDSKQGKLKQCWFPGVHSDIGGSYFDAQPLDSRDLSLAWMIAQCKGMLKFDEGQIASWLEQCQKPPSTGKPSMYGAMPSHHAEAINGVFMVRAKAHRTPGEYRPEDPLAKNGTTNETIHPSVRIRLLKLHDQKGRWKKVVITKKDSAWSPGNRKRVPPVNEVDIEYTLEWDPQALAGWKLVCTEGADKKLAWTWVKGERGDRIEIPEEVIEEGSFESQFLQDDDKALLKDVEAAKALPVVFERYLGVANSVAVGVEATGSTVYNAASRTGSAIYSMVSSWGGKGQS